MNVGKGVIWVWEGVGVLEMMGNEGVRKGGMMEGWGVNGRVLLVCVVFFLNRGCAWGSDRENGDSLVKEVFVRIDVCCVIEGLLMLLELDELDICNCDKGLNSIAIFVMVEID